MKTTPGINFVANSVKIFVEKKKEGPAPDAPWIELTKEGLLPRFNSVPELKVEVQPGANKKGWNFEAKDRVP